MGILTEIKLIIHDEKQKLISFVYLSYVLEVRRRRDGCVSRTWCTHHQGMLNSGVQHLGRCFRILRVWCGGVWVAFVQRWLLCLNPSASRGTRMWFQTDCKTTSYSLEAWGRGHLITFGKCQQEFVSCGPLNAKALAVVEGQSSFYILKMKDAANIPIKVTDLCEGLWDSQKTCKFCDLHINQKMNRGAPESKNAIGHTDGCWFWLSRMVGFEPWTSHSIPM